MTRKYKKLTEQDLQFIVDNALEMTKKEIAEKLGIAETAISGYMTTLRKLGVDIPKKSFRGNRDTILTFADKWKKEHQVV